METPDEPIAGIPVGRDRLPARETHAGSSPVLTIGRARLRLLTALDVVQRCRQDLEEALRAHDLPASRRRRRREARRRDAFVRGVRERLAQMDRAYKKEHEDHQAGHGAEASQEIR